MTIRLFLKYYNKLAPVKKRITFIEADFDKRIDHTLKSICKTIDELNLDTERFVRAQFEFVKGNLTLLSFLGNNALDRYNKCEPQKYEEQTKFQEIIQNVKYSKIQLDNAKKHGILNSKTIDNLITRELLDPYTLAYFNIFINSAVKEAWNKDNFLRKTIKEILNDYSSE